MICIFLCGAVVSGMFSNRIDHRIEVCEAVVESAMRHGVDPIRAISVSQVESGLQRGLVSKAGAEGPMQVIRRFWCKSEPCNLIDAGMSALKYYTDKYGHREGLCRYSSGKSCSDSAGARRYQKRVSEVLSAVSSIDSEVCLDGC